MTVGVKWSKEPVVSTRIVGGSLDHKNGLGSADAQIIADLGHFLDIVEVVD